MSKPRKQTEEQAQAKKDYDNLVKRVYRQAAVGKSLPSVRTATAYRIVDNSTVASLCLEVAHRHGFHATSHEMLDGVCRTLSISTCIPTTVSATDAELFSVVWSAIDNVVREYGAYCNKHEIDAV